MTLLMWAAVGGEPSWGDLAVLGTYALAMIVGYVGCFRLQVMHERKQTDQERADRREAEARERKTQEAALPALQEAVRAMDQVSRMLDRQSRP